MEILGIGWGELLIILVVVMLVWGPGRIIEISRTLGKTVAAFKRAANEVSTQMTKEVEGQKQIQTGENSQPKNAEGHQPS